MVMTSFIPLFLLQHCTSLLCLPLESVLTGSYLDLVWSWTANATMWKTQRARTCIVFSNLLLI